MIGKTDELYTPTRILYAKITHTVVITVQVRASGGGAWNAWCWQQIDLCLVTVLHEEAGTGEASMCRETHDEMERWRRK